MGKCQVCNANSPLISTQLGVCINCIRTKPEKALKISKHAHIKARKPFNLPSEPTQTLNGIQCGQCANQCKIGKDEKGYCGLVENKQGRLVRHGGTPEKGILEWYYDSLPTNCVSWWLCPGCTGAGYPKYAYNHTAETGYSNLAVFYGSCNMSCLFCQNWHHKELAQKHKPAISAEQLASKVNEKTSCICFFGGDPSSQMPHALKTSRLALIDAFDKHRILRICWETNGQMLPKYAQQAAELSLKSGGNMKFDLKTSNENLNVAISGISNNVTLENFERIGKRYCNQRPELPLLTAGTLLVSGYVDALEVEKIAKFIADIDSTIPYTLLAFYPTHILNDLPITTKKNADKCFNIAKKYLANVKISNMYLLF